MLLFEEILQSGETEEEAIEYARGMVWCEIEAREQCVKHSRYIDTVDGINVYYNYAADYYAFGPNN